MKHELWCQTSLKGSNYHGETITNVKFLDLKLSAV